jgi:AcrR family transcriptional regulator
MGRTYLGATADERRAQRRRRLLDAGLQCFGTAGFARTRVKDVCGEAKLTERYFYEAFSGLEALLVAVFDEVVEDTGACILDAVEAAPPDDELARARLALTAFVERLTDDPRRLHVLYVDARGTSAALDERRVAALQAGAQLVVDAAAAFYGADRVPRTDATLTATALVGGTAELLLAWHRGDLDVPRERLVDHAAALFVAASGVRSADGAGER